jgi:transmembrane sensor
MKNYSQFTVEDFVQDPYFQEWVLNKTPKTQLNWDAFCDTYPEQNSNIAQAQSMVRALKIKAIPIAESDIQRGIDRILAMTEPIEDSVETPIVPLFRRGWFRIAASIALLISVGFWWMNKGGFTLKMGQNSIYTEGGMVEQKVANTEDKPFTITLPDGSTVVLEKNSQIQYEKDFKGAVREVHLTGEALFDVVKNPNKPFIVHAGNLVTKVLGTSFRIKAFDKSKEVTVDVIRGRVSVFADKKDKQKDPETDGLVLTPNQKGIFEKTEARLKRTLIEKPVVVVSQETLKLFVFDEAPVSKIFKALEEAYGVEIIYDEEVLKQCALTTTLRNETLFDKLSIICKSIGATYKVVDAQVVIEGEACK